MAVRKGTSRNLEQPLTGVLLLLVVFLVLAIMLPENPAWNLIPGRDSGMFQYTAWRLLEGDVLYQEAWENKPPMIFFTNALGLLIDSGSRWAVWTFEVSAILAASVVGFLLLKRSFGLLPAVFGSVCWLLALLLIEKDNYTEEYALPFQFLALYLFWLAERRGRYGWLGLAMGVAGGISFMFRQNLIGVWVAIGAYVLIERARSRRWGRLLADALPIVLGGLSVLLVIVAYFGLSGALADFWDAAFRYNFVYSARGQPLPLPAKVWHSSTAGLGLIVRSGLPVFALLGWASGVARIALAARLGGDARPVHGPLLSVALLALPVELLLSSVMGRIYGHYYIAWLPVMAILAGYLAWLVIDSVPLNVRIPGWHGQPANLLGLALLGVLAALSITPVANQLFKDLSFLMNPRRSVGEKAIVAYIADNTAPQDYVLIWGSETSYYLLARRRTPVRYLHQPNLYTPGFYSADRMQEITEDVITRQPALIIDASVNAEVPPLDGDSPPPELAPLFDYIAGNYERVGTLTHWSGEWPIYQYTGGE